ncbi:MAG TPA: hypothetical protein VES65_03525 [Solirubrobacteraceae bacterium]|nr:hypothetical protein [Solirubrobacteraceae bacterium]
MPDEEERLAEGRAAATRARVGHPGERWSTLIERVQRDAIRDFSAVEEDFLALMWCLDQYRIADAPPFGMGNPKANPQSRMDGIYRGKGHWFSTLLGLLLDNRTGQKIRSRSKIRGYSQKHQIDLAWPDRDIAPIVCAESKITGGPAYRKYRARGAMDDWTNRRKELKFAATDLKLSRRDQTVRIGHWAVWRSKAAPMAFMLWGARLSDGDSIDRMVRETEALLATYLDGAGIFAWRENEAGTGYRPVPLPDGSNVEDLDSALWRIESEIADASSTGALSVPVEPSAPVDPALLLEDE